MSARQQDLPNVGRAPWSFRTKLELAAELVEWCAIFFQNCFRRSVMVIADGTYAKRPFLSRVKKTGAHRDQPPAEERRAVRASPAFRKTPKRTTAYLREQQTIPKSTEQPSPRLDSDPHEAVWPRVNRALQDIPGDVSPGWQCDPRDDCESTRGSCLPTVRLTGQRSSAQIPKSTSKRCLRLSPTAPPSNRIFTT